MDEAGMDRIKLNTIFIALVVLLRACCGDCAIPRCRTCAEFFRFASTVALMVVGRIVRCFTTTAVTLIVVLCLTLRAQELEPRAYSNSPTGLNFAIVGYGNAKGSVLTDPSLPLDNVSNESHVALFAYATTLNVLGKSAKVDVIVPYVWLTANGVAFGVPRQRYVTGFADPAFRFSMNFIGAPALTAAEFKDYRQNFILARACASLRRSANTTATSS
jgi:hypothetical protein